MPGGVKKARHKTVGYDSLTVTDGRGSSAVMRVWQAAMGKRTAWEGHWKCLCLALGGDYSGV